MGRNVRWIRVLVAAELYERLWREKSNRHVSWDDAFAQMADLWLKAKIGEATTAESRAT